MSVEYAWAAGFFDGEGCIICLRQKRHKGGNGKHYSLTSVQMSLCQVRREPLDRFVEAVGVGQVRGPYHPKNKAHSPYFKWQISGRPICYHAITRLWKYLSLPKREQIQGVWAELASLRTVKSPQLPELPV